MSIGYPNLGLVYHEGAGADMPTLVAIVVYKADTHAAALEECFELTNNIEHDWRHNDSVIVTPFGTGRSTSVGDFIQLGLHLYRCDPMGWTHVAPSRWQFIKSFFTRRAS